MTLNNLLLQYEYQKLNGGYEPNCSKEEIVDFLYFYEQFHSSEQVIPKTENAIKKALLSDKIKSDNEFLIIPTYEFTDKDLSHLEKSSYKKRKELEITINNYLRNLPKRSSKDGFYTNEEIEFAKHSAALIVEFIWNNYIDNYIDRGKWPIQCRDINKYLFENDLASMIDIPSIRDDILKFYSETVEKILTLRKENPNFKVSTITDSLLAKANSSFITRGYDNLFGYCKKRTIEIDGATKEFTNRARADGVYIHEDIIYSDISMRKEAIGSARTKKIIETINNL